MLLDIFHIENPLDAALLLNVWLNLLLSGNLLREEANEGEGAERGALKLLCEEGREAIRVAIGCKLVLVSWIGIVR